MPDGARPALLEQVAVPDAEHQVAAVAARVRRGRDHKLQRLVERGLAAGHYLAGKSTKAQRDNRHPQMNIVQEPGRSQQASCIRRQGACCVWRGWRGPGWPPRRGPAPTCDCFFSPPSMPSTRAVTKLRRPQACVSSCAADEPSALHACSLTWQSTACELVNYVRPHGTNDHAGHSCSDRNPGMHTGTAAVCGLLLSQQVLQQDIKHTSRSAALV